ncbi:sensor histidine kinase [Oerskovia turbata]
MPLRRAVTTPPPAAASGPVAGPAPGPASATDPATVATSAATPPLAAPAGSSPAALTERQVVPQGPIRRLLAARPWAADGVLALAVLLLGVVTSAIAQDTVAGSTGLGLFLPDSEARGLVPAVWLAGAVVGAALLTARRAFPLGVTAALTVAAVGSLATGGVLGVLGVCLACAVYSIAATGAPRTTWAACAVVLVVVTAAIWRWQDIGLAELIAWSDPLLTTLDEPARQLSAPPFSGGRRSVSALLLLALLLLGVALGTTARARREHALDLVERYAALARERDQSAALARAAERARIAREMHDVVAHSVSVMVALSDGAGAALDRAPERSREALRELSRTGRGALSDMQGVLGALDPDDGAAPAPGGDSPGPVAADLATVVERFRAAGVPVRTWGLDVLPHDTALRLAVTRVVTEALTNVLRHAPGAPRADVVVRRGDATVEVEVLDAGGTRPGTGGGTGRGILGMRERAALLGGHVDAGPHPDGGWRVRVELPVGRHDLPVGASGLSVGHGDLPEGHSGLPGGHSDDGGRG